MKKNILLIDSPIYPRNFDKYLSKISNGRIVIVKENKKEIIKKLPNMNALINCPRRFFDTDILKNGKKLEWVHSGGAGIEEYLFKDFVNSNIKFTNGKIIQGTEIADHAIGLVLSISRNIYLYASNKEHKLKRPIELKNKICGIIGLGGIGLPLAERLKTFGMKVIGFSEELLPMVSFIDELYRGKDINDKIQMMDVVVCTAPLTKITKKILSKNLLKKMKNQSILINVSRGALIDNEALLDPKIHSKFLGIGLDVTDPDPLPKNHKLRKLRNIIITDHTSGLSDNNRLRSKELMIENIKRFCNNMSLLNVVDKHKGY